MHSFQKLVVAFAALVPSVLSSALPAEAGLGLERRQTVTNVGPNCGNTPTTRSSWCPNFSITTDADLNIPSTGVTVSYTFNIARGPCNPDGSGGRTCTLVNGQYPGPTIRANWGDKIVVTVNNGLTDNGTDIHWHGVRQYHTNTADGVNGVTGCPIAPGKSKTYTFMATAHGTSWYHSHHSSQLADGVVGSIIINGPATANYDVDLGVLPLTDWFYTSAWTVSARAIHSFGPPPQAQNILVNGTMKSAAGQGSYATVNVVAGKTYRMRIINMAADQWFVFSMDNHPFSVIAADFNPVQPKTGVTQVTLAMGQRYDIIFTASASVGNYWMRVRYGCGPGGVADIYNAQTSTVPGAILHYSGAPTANPTSSSYSISQTCNDESLTMEWPRSVPSSSAISNLGIGLGTATWVPGDTIVAWTVNSQPMFANWSNPTLQQVAAGATTFAAPMNVYQLNGGSTTWTYWVIQWAGQGGPPLPHPIHLHGHNFYVLGSGSGSFSSSASLNYNTPVRRDTATLPANGWLVVAFLLDNPGAWLMHCHIAWHVSEGFSLQFVERRSEIVSTVPSADLTAMNSNCQNWRTWYNSPSRLYAEEDSGL